MLARAQQVGLNAIGKGDQTVDPAFDELLAKFKELSAGTDALEKACRFHHSTVMSNLAALGSLKLEFDRTFAFSPVDTKVGKRTRCRHRRARQTSSREAAPASSDADECFGCAVRVRVARRRGYRCSTAR
jgi:hypothetical protein